MWYNPYDITEVCYDMYGAMQPEEAMLPISYWSKARILNYLRSCRNPPVDGDTVQKLEGWKLEDLRSIALKEYAKFPTGSKRSMMDGGHRWRNTMHYKLDLESVNSLF